MRIKTDGKNVNESAIYSVDKITGYLNFYPCANDKQMARFYIKNFGHVLNIIPGTRSKNSASLTQEAHLYKNRAIHILNANEENNMTLTIDQGIPAQKYFMIALPHKGNNERVSLDPSKPKTVYEMKNPRSGEKTKAELNSYYVWDLYDIPESWCLLSYGIGSEKLVPLLIEKYPELNSNPKVEFLVLKKL